MKRLAAAVLCLALIGLVASGVDVERFAARLPGAQFFGLNASPAGAYRVDAVFDTAKGIIPGQLVKVAGVKVGIVSHVALTRDYKARIEMSVDPRFAPFRSDARCQIRPEGLTAENFVQCNPGTPAGRPLPASAGRPPTVPVSRTTIPINLNGLFEVWNAPTADRLQILLNELGLGVVARGDQINAILRRTNPALTEARRTIAILSGERRQLATVVDATDRVAGELARRPDRVRDFVRQAARLATTGAAHGRGLAETVRRLPELLRAARPTLRHADRFAVRARPLTVALRGSARPFANVLDDLQTFAHASRGPLAGLRRTVEHSRPVLSGARPTLEAARRFTDTAKPVAPRLASLFTNLRDRGLIEGSLKLFYYVAAASARFDSTSHILPSEVLLNSCSEYATTPVPGCSAHYSDQAAASAPTARADGGGGSAARIAMRALPHRGAQTPSPRRGRPGPSPSPPHQAPAPPPPHHESPPTPAPNPPPPSSSGGGGSGQAIDNLLRFLLG